MFVVPFAHADLTQDIVAYYALDETSGTNALDLTGNGNDGTASNSAVFTSAAAGIINTGADFTGGNYWLNTGINPGSVIGSGDYTVSAWVNFNSLVASGRVWQLGENNAINDATFLYLSGNTISVFSRVGSSGSELTQMNTTASTGVWYHVVVRRTGNTIDIYVDGVKHGTTTSSDNAVSAFSRFYLGATTQNTPSAFGNHVMDEVSLWNRLLTPAEILDLYNKQKDGFESGQYPFTTDVTITSNSYSGLKLQSFDYEIRQGGSLVEAGFTTNGTVFTQILLNDTSAYNISIFPPEFVCPGGCPSSVTTNQFVRKDILNYVPSVSGSLVFNYSVLNISAVSLLTQAPINTFNGSINVFSQNNPDINRINQSTTNASIYFFVSPATFNGIFNSPGSSQVIQNITSVEGINNIQIEFFTENDVQFNFRDEQTNNPILNVSYQLISPLLSFNQSTTNGTIFLNSLPSGNYELRYESFGYNPRSAFIFIPLTESINANRTLYLLNISEGDYYLPVILDENENVVPNSYFQALRWYTIGNNQGEYRVVETSQIDAQGRATMFLEYNTAAYIFRLLQNGQILQSYPTPKFLFSQTEFYRFSTGSQLISSYRNLGNFQATLEYIEGQDDFFRLQYNDINNFASQVCLFVNFRSGITDNTTQICTSADQATLTQVVNGSIGGVYRAWVRVTAEVDGTQYNIENIVIDNRSLAGFTALGSFGLFLLFMSLLVGVLITIGSPIVGLSFIVVILLAFSASVFGIIAINPAFIGAFIVAGIVLAYIFRSDKT